MAYKRLNEEEYAQADAGLREAKLALQDREEKLMAVYNQLETGMSLIGATAVEDRWVQIQHAEIKQLYLNTIQIFMSSVTFFFYHKHFL